MRAIIQSEKHYVQNPVFAIAASAVGRSIFVTAVAVADKNAAQEVEEGSIIKAIYIELWINSNAATIGSGNVTLEKINTTQTAMTFTESQNLGSYANKKNIFYTTQGLFPDESSNPVIAVRQWFKIPKGKQRFGLGDQLVLNMAAITGGIEGCGFATYKEYK